MEAQILSLGRATGGLAGGFEGVGAAAREEARWPMAAAGVAWGAAAAEGGRHLNPLEATHRSSDAPLAKAEARTCRVWG